MTVFYEDQKGVVVVAKDPNSNIIEVHPNEQLPFSSGDLTDEAKLHGVGTDVVVTTESISCQWWSTNAPNRLTSPDVRVGSIVRIFRVTPDGKWYWDLLDNDTHNRTNERIVSGIASKSSNDGEALTEDNAYLFHLDSMNQFIGITTSKQAGEPFTYSIKLDTANGNFTLKDSNDNLFFIDSAHGQFHFNNKDGNFIDLKENVLSIKTLEKINIETEEMNIKVSDLNIEAKNIDTKSENQNTVNGSNFNFVNGGEYNLKTPTGAINGNMTVSGGVKTEGEITSGTVSLEHHVHGGVKRDDQFTDPPKEI